MPFIVGEQVGAYRIVEQLGQGGMSTVYKAYHAALDRYVALKVLHPVFKGDRDFLQRFQREARIVARLEHPYIVPVYDFSEHEGTPYLVMRYVEGRTLKAVLAEAAPLPMDRILAILRPVCEALAYAHGQGVLHRDIKPSNILIGQEGKVYVTDFGLAKMAQTGDSTISQDRMIGTPQYISPEQAKGEPLDHRTDLYSLGVVLFEMVTGRVPYTADTPFAVIHDHIFSPLPLPSRLNPGVPPAVEQVILKALAKSPDDRFQDATEFLCTLEGVVRGLPDAAKPAGTAAAPPGAAPEAAPAMVRPAGEAAETAAPRPKRRSRPKKTKPEDRPAAMAPAAAPGPSLRESATTLWEAIGSAISRPLAEARDKVAAEVSKAAEQARQNLAAEMAAAADKIRQEVAAAGQPESTAVGEPAESGVRAVLMASGMALVQPARPSKKRRFRWWIPALVGGLLLAVLVFFLAVWRPLALRRAERAWMRVGQDLSRRLGSRVAGRGPTAGIPIRVADAYPRAGEPMPAPEAEQALRRLEGRIAQEPRNPILRLQQGDAFYDLQRWPEAAQSYREAINLAPELASAHYNLGTTYLHMDQMEEAIHELRRAMELLPPGREAEATYFNLALACTMAGEREQALMALQRFLEVHPQDDPWRKKAEMLLHFLQQP